MDEPESSPERALASKREAFRDAVLRSLRKPPAIVHVGEDRSGPAAGRAFGAEPYDQRA